MVLLLGIGFVAGLITAVSPCVLPVLPIVLAGGSAGETRRRPYAIVAGLVLSFTVFTLSASALLSALGLPLDNLRNIAIALLFVVAATLLVPRLGMVIEAPLLRLSRRPSGDLGGGFLLGVSPRPLLAASTDPAGPLGVIPELAQPRVLSPGAARVTASVGSGRAN